MLYHFECCDSYPLHFPQCSVLLPILGVPEKCRYAPLDGVLNSHGLIQDMDMVADIGEVGEDDGLVFTGDLHWRSLQTGTVHPASELLRARTRTK